MHSIKRSVPMLVSLLLFSAITGASGQRAGIAGADVDSDGDGLSDYAEIHKYFTNPHQADTGCTGTRDGDWDKRREFTYTISSVLKIAKPFDIRAMNDDYQDARILAQDETSCTVEIVYYPLNTNREAIGANRNWRKEDAGMQEYLRPTPTENWDEKMRADLLAELKRAGIEPDRLTDKELVARVAAWAMHRSKFNSAFAIWYVQYLQGKPTVYPPLRQAFDAQKPDKNVSDQTMFDHEVLGRQMYYNRTYGSCTSCSIYLTTILRALGIPTRIVVCIPPCDMNDHAQVARFVDGIHHHAIRAAVMRGLREQGFANHLFNEVYVGHRWVRLNYNDLGQNILDSHFFGMLTHIDTTASVSSLPLAQTWGMRYAQYGSDPDAPAVAPRLSSANPYMLLSVSDHFGRYAHIANPEVPMSELRAVTINGLYWRDSPLLPEWVDKKQFDIIPTDLLIGIKEWIATDDYHQLRQFEGRAGNRFLLKAPGHPDLSLTLNGVKISDEKGAFQVFGACLAAEDRDKLVKGIDYTLVPINTSGVYRWTTGEGVVLRVNQP